LVEAVPALSYLLGELDPAMVEDMADGGMGSIRFLAKHGTTNRQAREVASASYKDIDGAEVSVALNVDQHGDLFEVDMWKVDFSPLIQYPRASELSIGERHPDG